MRVQRTIHIPLRPDAGGKCGRPVEVIANCWDISVCPKSVLMYFIETVAVFRLDKAKGEKVELRVPLKEKRAFLHQVIKA